MDGVGALRIQDITIMLELKKIPKDGWEHWVLTLLKLHSIRKEHYAEKDK